MSRAVSDTATTHRQSADGCGPYSRPGKLALVNGSTAEGRFLAKATAELTAFVGGSPSIIQAKLISQAARLSLRLHLMDTRSIADAEYAERCAKQYLAWHGAYCRTLAQIASSAKGAKKPAATSFAELIAEAS